jgi:hypothetical protein
MTEDHLRLALVVPHPSKTATDGAAEVILAYAENRAESEIRPELALQGSVE